MTLQLCCVLWQLHVSVVSLHHSYACLTHQTVLTQCLRISIHTSPETHALPAVPCCSVLIRLTYTMLVVSTHTHDTHTLSPSTTQAPTYSLTSPQFCQQ